MSLGWDLGVAIRGRVSGVALMDFRCLSTLLKAAKIRYQS